MFKKLAGSTIIGLLIITFLFTGCSKSSDQQNTSLQISVIETIGGPGLPGAMVRLLIRKSFTPVIDSLVGTQLTDANGMATFNNLSPIQYNFNAEKGCLKAKYFSSIFRPLVENEVNTASVSMEETGILKIINNSTDTYLVTGPDYFSANISGNSTGYYVIESGSQTIFGEAASTPGIGVNKLINLSCGDTTVISYP